MRIERLEVFGFKSFMERLVLPLERGITGVVGPNGCGKSNIIDALRWVLGETRASQLRGGVLEDVIFNGTESLRPLGLAEVSLVIRADGESLYHDLLSYYQETESAPSSDERGEAAPSAVNDDQVHVVSADEKIQPAEANSDVAQMAAAAEQVGHGADAPPSAIDTSPQNHDEEVASPEVPSIEAPSAVAPEAGPPAEGDFMADIRASLSKYSWLRSVSEVQVTRRLYRSGESEFFINKVQCRLRDVKDFFRIVGLAARGYTIIAQGEIGRIITAKPDDRRLVIEEAAHIAGFREHMNAVSKRLEDTRGQVVRLEDVIKEVTRQVGNLKRQAARAITRAELKEQLIVAEKQLIEDSFVRTARRRVEIGARCESLAENEAVLSEALTTARSGEQGARETTVRFDAEMDVLRKRAEEIKDEINKRNREVTAKESRLRELNSVVHARNAEIRRVEERRIVLTQRQEESATALQRMEMLERELEEQLSTIDTGGEEEMKEIFIRLQALREDQRVKDRSIREMRDRLVSAQSRREALQSQITAASPITHLKRALGENKLSPEITGNQRLLVDGIKVPDRFTKALQAVLAERASFLVVDEVTKVARTFQELVLRADPSNKKGLGVGLFAALPPLEGEACVAIQADRSEPPLPEGIVSLLSTIEIAPWCSGLVSRLLAKVWVAANLDCALQFLESARGSSLVDEDTVIVTESGDLLSAWSFYSLRHEGGLIQIKSKVDEATRIIEETQGIYDQTVAERDEIVRQISDGERRHAELVRNIQQAQARLREISNKQAEVRGRLASERKVSQQLQNDVQRIEPQLEEVRQQLALLERSVAEVNDELSILKQRDNSEVEKAYSEVSASLRGMEDQRRALRDSMGQLLREIELKRQAHEAARERLIRERMSAERCQSDLEGTERIVRERYGEEVVAELRGRIANADLLPDEVRRELDSKVVGIKQRLDREGEVDPAVIEQHEVESKRLEELTAQREDLVNAVATLERTLGELSEACTRRFTSTFEAIRENFAYFGPKLFGGGSAEIVLVDPTKPLETGVDITVRPPGKKPKSIDLLSGGEKCLCATALVFAMFMVRPSPLCVLDEVDAPLDEANVHRFVTFIKEMSAKTQFLMVTHNKQSMATADTLVGVTMPQPGASKVLTVSLQEAVKQVA